MHLNWLRYLVELRNRAIDSLAESMRDWRRGVGL
jgi:hypothetical protein